MTGQPAILMLDDGSVFHGTACGACSEASGEVVFTTGMAGYQETLTDPSYHGQIIAFTAAHLGNYGITSLDDEASSIRASGAIFHDLFQPEESGFPHWRAEGSLDDFLRSAAVTGIRNIDTRALTLHLREHGSRNGIISATDLDIPSLLRRVRELPSMQGRDLAREVSCAVPYAYHGDVDRGPVDRAPRPLRVAVLDFGVKKSILDCLVAANLRPTVWPADTHADTILESSPDGLFLSNGPGDPEPCTYAIQTVKKLLGKLPIFGICLGHQILALALGGKTYKLAFGHHGVNHPVTDLSSGRVWITSQNHGFCVDPDSLPPSVTPSHWNLNDRTLEGMVCQNLPAFSVQFHPEAGPGPADARPLFNRFRTLIENNLPG